MDLRYAHLSHISLFVVLTLITIGAGCSATNKTSSNTDQTNTGNIVCDENYFKNQLNTFNATQFEIQPPNPVGGHAYAENKFCEYLGYIQEDDVNNFTTMGMVDIDAKEYFDDMLAGAKLNGRWIVDEKSTPTAESFFVELLPISLSSNLSTWNLYTYENGVTYAIEGVIQNNNHTPQETKEFIRRLALKLMEIE